VLSLIHTFDDDWALAEPAAQELDTVGPKAKTARKVAKAVVKDLPAVAPFLNGDSKMEDLVKEVVMQVVKKTVEEPADDAR